MSQDHEQMHIGHYVLGKTIGCGGFARVRQGRHDLTGTKVAVKIINKAKMKNKNMISKTKREIKILKFINHPNIIKLYEVLDTTTDIYVVMELAQGGQLYNFIQNNDFSEDQARHFFKQIIEGVQSAHLHLVAHRDLKPENILLGPNNLVKIADFGLSNLMKDGKLLKTSCGSLNYAAPQIIGHRSYEGTAVDVWSCGVILYTMLVGALPFDDEILSILYRKIEKAEFQIPQFVSPLAKDLLHRMITANPCDRLRTKDIKIHPWLRKTIPLYAREISLAPSVSQPIFIQDLQILSKVRSYNMQSLRNIHDEQRIKKVLQRRTDDSFVLAYQLLRHEKEGRQMQKAAEQESKPLILNEIANRLITTTLQNDPSIQYGYVYNKPPRTIIQTLLDIFDSMNIEYTIKDSQYCILCSYSLLQTSLRRRKSSRIEELAYTSQEQRFRRDRINFILQLYSKPDSIEVVMDLKLVQGHPLTFIAFSKNIYKQLQQALQG